MARRLIFVAIAVFVVIDLIVLVPQLRLFGLWASGRAKWCSLPESLDSRNVLVRRAKAGQPVQHIRDDGAFALYATALGDFWIPRRGEVAQQESMIHGLVREQLDNIYGGVSGGVRKGNVVIDCGANVGTFTRFALKRGARRVIMVEPSPGNLETLRRNFKEELDRGIVEIRPVAVWDTPQVLTFNENIASAVDSAIFRHPGAIRSIQVEAQTLDQIADKDAAVDFIKVDVEGAEAKVILGAKKLLQRTRPRLVFDVELTPLDDVAAAVMAARSDYQRACQCEDFGTSIRASVAYFY